MGIREVNWIDGWPSIWTRLETQWTADAASAGQVLSVALKNAGEASSTAGFDVVSLHVSLPSASPSPSPPQSTPATCSPSSSSTVLDTVIVGAGGAGLFAGYTLQRNGYESFRLLEASSSVGGRIRDVPADFTGDGFRLDLGAAFAFNGIDGLRQVLDLNEDEDFDTAVSLFDPDNTRSCDISSGGSVTCETLDGSGIVEDVFVNGTYFGYLSRYVIPYVNSKIELDTRVTTVNYSDGDWVTVCTSSGQTYQAKSVVMAVPLAVLQDGAIAFEPPLPPSYRNAIDSRPNVGGLRFWVEFSERFYAENLQIFREDSFATYYFDATFGEPAASGRHIVTNLGIGQNGLAALSDDEVIERVLDDLDRVYNGDARRTYVQHRVQNWSAEPSRGVFSDDSPGVEPHYDVYAEPIDGRLYIAGEFAIEGRAFFESGRNTAEKIIEASPSPSPSPSPTPSPSPSPSPSPPTWIELASRNTNTCSSGFSKPRSEAQCRAAAQILAALGCGRCAVEWDGTERDSGAPSGCYAWDGELLYWNTHGRGGSNRDSQPVCVSDDAGFLAGAALPALHHTSSR